MIAARKLLEAGLTPLVLEADERVGGRILTQEVMPGVPVELGAQWIGDTHERMFRLAAELGVETFAQYDEGDTSYELVGSGVLRENEFHARFESELKELDTGIAPARRAGRRGSRRSTVDGAACARVGRRHRGCLV